MVSMSDSSTALAKIRKMNKFIMGCESKQRMNAKSQGHQTIIFGEICVPESQTVLRISVLPCLTATYFFTKTSAKRLATREK